jgi:uncharacterized protein YpbB
MSNKTKSVSLTTIPEANYDVLTRALDTENGQRLPMTPRKTIEQKIVEILCREYPVKIKTQSTVKS